MTADVIDFPERRTNSEGSFYNSDHYAEVRPFTPKIARCSICSSANHRATRCPLRPRVASPRDYLKTD